MSKQRDVVTKTALVPLRSLKHYRRNARLHNLDVIRESLREHGQLQELIVDKRSNEVLAGNGTMKAMRAEGWTEALVSFVDVDDAKARRINLVDNRASDDGTYDNALMLEQLQALDGDLSGTGFDQQNVSELFDLIQETEQQGMVVIPYQAGGGKAARGGVLAIGPKLKVRLSDNEVTGLDSALANYRDETGGDAGFMAWLINGRA